MQKLWTPSEYLIETPIRIWKHEWIPPDVPHIYIHIFDGKLRYVGASGNNRRSMTKSGRTQEHLIAWERSTSGEIRHYPVSCIVDAYRFENYTIDRAVEEGHGLFNRTRNAKGIAFMRQYLPKMYVRYMNDEIWRKYKCRL